MNLTQRIKSIDFFRGLCITWMIFGHLSEWWMQQDLFDFINTPGRGFFTIMDFLGAAGLLFISGMSITISYRKKLERKRQYNDFNFKKYRIEYIIRAFLLFIIGILYNIFESIKIGDYSKMWIWFILQTLPLCLLISWPFLKLNKYYKIIVAVIFLTINEILIFYLLPYKGQYNNIEGILFYILYNGVNLSPILQFFSFFIIGSFIGDVIHENISSIELNKHTSVEFLKKITLPLLSLGISLIIISTLILPNNPFQDYYVPRNFSWVLYSIGCLTCLYISILIIEKCELIRIKTKYRFFYYFSFYSFSIFLIHLPLFYIFYKRLDFLSFILITPITIILIGLMLKIIHNKLNTHFSIKVQISRISSYIARVFIKDQKDSKEKNKITI
ncbi:MAG: DUF1624 domain-containing protein [Candidatus Lokiarchaeota archaeon]|nr:DUF1624 domain-containing protein [Candidatus Lokiarchaeota archaeon]